MANTQKITLADTGEVVDRPDFLNFMRGKWRFKPSKRLMDIGARFLSFDSYGSEQHLQVLAILNECERVLSGKPAIDSEYGHRQGTIGWAFKKALSNRSLIAQSEERELLPPGKDDWHRNWKWLKSFADREPATVTLKEILDVCREAEKTSDRERHSFVRIWRMLWKRMASYGICHIDRDPSKEFENNSPPSRREFWRAAEVMTLINSAMENGYHGVAVTIAICWDSLCSPVDVRKLTISQLNRSEQGLFFVTARQKTGKPVIATISDIAARLLGHYVKLYAEHIVDDAPFILSRGWGKADHAAPAAYGDVTLARDFAKVRKLAFGEDETRRLSDLRRSGTMEIFAGAGEEAAKLAAEKLANSINRSFVLQQTYNPQQVNKVFAADFARASGRTVLEAAAQNPVSKQEIINGFTTPKIAGFLTDQSGAK